MKRKKEAASLNVLAAAVPLCFSRRHVNTPSLTGNLPDCMLTTEAHVESVGSNVILIPRRFPQRDCLRGKCSLSSHAGVCVYARSRRQ